jgi:type IV pilus assembly protein PilN
MIRINLLPHREAKRKQKQAAFVALLALGGLPARRWCCWWAATTPAASRSRTSATWCSRTPTRSSTRRSSKIASLKSEIEALKARQQAVEDLQGDRNQPVYLLDELVRQTPEGVYLKSFKQDGQRVLLNGYAQSQERVAELLRNLSGNSPWLERPDLTEVRAATLAQSKTGRKVVEFTLNVAIKRARAADDDETATTRTSKAGGKVMNIDLKQSGRRPGGPVRGPAGPPPRPVAAGAAPVVRGRRDGGRPRPRLLLVLERPVRRTGRPGRAGTDKLRDDYRSRWRRRSTWTRWKPSSSR